MLFLRGENIKKYKGRATDESVTKSSHLGQFSRSHTVYLAERLQLDYIVPMWVALLKFKSRRSACIAPIHLVLNKSGGAMRFTNFPGIPRFVHILLMRPYV